MCGHEKVEGKPGHASHDVQEVKETNVVGECLRCLRYYDAKEESEADVNESEACIHYDHHDCGLLVPF